MRHRCVGTLNGPAADCPRPIAGALLCYGYLDLHGGDLALPLEEALEGPRPLLFPACKLHRPALEEWAEHLWGQVADGLWVEPRAIPKVLGWMEAERDPVLVSPDPKVAVGIH